MSRSWRAAIRRVLRVRCLPKRLLPVRTMSCRGSQTNPKFCRPGKKRILDLSVFDSARSSTSLSCSAFVEQKATTVQFAFSQNWRLRRKALRLDSLRRKSPAAKSASWQWRRGSSEGEDGSRILERTGTPSGMGEDDLSDVSIHIW